MQVDVLLVELHPVTKNFPTVWAQEAHNFRGVTLQITQGNTIVLRIHNVTAVNEASEGDYLMTAITHRPTEIYPLHNGGLVGIEHLVSLLEGG